jgi:membrane protease YdiL (CAAX protease family)
MTAAISARPGTVVGRMTGGRHRAGHSRRAWLVLGGLALAVAARAVAPRSTPDEAVVTGALFGLGLIALAATAGRFGLGRGRLGLGAGLGRFGLGLGRPGVDLRRLGRAIALGTLGGLVLVGLALVGRTGLVPGSIPGLALGAWAGATLLVAAGEELVLRGAAFRPLLQAAGPAVAIIVTAAAFALMHVPFYGFDVIPLDFGVGIWLGALRLVGGSVAAPIAAHAVADLATWWL